MPTVKQSDEPEAAKRATIVPFNPAQKRARASVALSVPAMRGNEPRPTPKPAKLDLTGRKTAWFLSGRGHTGKTMFARWLYGIAEENSASVMMAAADPGNRSLRRFMADVAEPPSTDQTDTRDWLYALLGAALTEKCNLVVDLGAGQTALADLPPNVWEMLSDGGIEPISLITVGPDPEDLTVLAMNEAAGFKPRATAIVLNEHAAQGRRGRFDDVLAHETLVAAVARGAVQLWMPALWADAEEECRRNGWKFRDVGQHADAFVTGAVQMWLREMDREFAPIRGWFPL